MKLSQFEGDAAFELMADIMEPAAEIMKDKKVEYMVRKKEPVLMIAAHVFRAHKKESTEIVKALHRDDEKVKINPLTVVKDLIDLLNDDELISLFTSQGQNTDVEPSGSAMESIADEEN